MTTFHSVIYKDLCLAWLASEKLPPAVYGDKYRDKQLDNV